MSNFTNPPYLLLSLQTVNDRCELAQNIVCLLMVLDLCSEKLREVAERFGRV